MSETNDCYGWALSQCCGASIKWTDICTACGEHCDTQCDNCDEQDKNSCDNAPKEI